MIGPRNENGVCIDKNECRFEKRHGQPAGGGPTVRFISNLHPIVLFAYFVSVLGIIMFATHPILLGASLVGAVLYALQSEGFAALRKTLLFAAVLIVAVAVTNPLFIHNGVTELFFVFGRAVTLEALCYGVSAGIMLASIVLWFKAYSSVMTSDKFLYLFGRMFPKLSLVLSMALRFVPLFITQTKAVHQVQKTMGMYTGTGIGERFLGGARVFSAVFTWSLENAVDTADSMKARGYGLPGRSVFSLYRFTLRDGIVMAIIAVLAAITAIGTAAGELSFYYYPAVSSFKISPLAIVSAAAATALMLLPAAVAVTERKIWNFYISKI